MDDSVLINPEDKHLGHPLAVVKVLNHLQLHSLDEMFLLNPLLSKHSYPVDVN